MTSHFDPRQTLRRQLRQARRNLPVTEQLDAASALVSNYIELLERLTIPPTKRVALYLSNDGEISPHLLCELFWQQNIETYLPVVQGKKLIFARYSVETTWQENIFGIKEPITAEYLAGNELDIVLLPLVGFDSKGGRLGMGGGFYDRTFEDKRADQTPLLIGLAHDCQEVKKLPIEGWDVPLQGILSPQQIIIV
ncbi:5-formyltetrahydrofolate cyclo-ligase [Marinomonas rhizomae]|uniref:5-formyltetrahydrofolate cyclo-ligase n=1 Tax=Marinomonas rhizomae TaxID=491948 RepID=A0A366J7X8_9GAMM|nr:5-formyltetrahydrofolate cyclo-ligase [Marinomonas rhizomae]RBP82510.1 5-formyltetrahydrofolate cyclo-ligase [Marinomonas rhizomae]RNF73701.1 5-formyltetrahydrofolate cyclo-ligase [Marinomonas rhizomae]